MIQRIQTLYWLAVAILGTLTCLLPLATFDSESLQCTLSAWQLTTESLGTVSVTAHFWGLFAMSVVSPAIAFVSIFFYKKRMLQIRLCVLNIALLLGFYAVYGVCIWQISSNLEANFLPETAAIFPFINLILTWLALRGVGKDEAKVRAADRLR